MNNMFVYVKIPQVPLRVSYKVHTALTYLHRKSGRVGALKGHSGAELHIYFLVHLESIYYEIFFYSKIVPNCAVAK